MPSFGTFLILFAAVAQNAPAEPHRVDGFHLQDFRGASFSLDDARTFMTAINIAMIPPTGVRWASSTTAC